MLARTSIPLFSSLCPPTNTPSPSSLVYLIYPRSDRPCLVTSNRTIPALLALSLSTAQLSLRPLNLNRTLRCAMVMSRHGPGQLSCRVGRFIVLGGIFGFACASLVHPGPPVSLVVPIARSTVCPWPLTLTLSTTTPLHTPFSPRVDATIAPNATDPTTRTKMSAQDKAARRARFEGAFDRIHEELIEHMKGEGLPQEAVQWFSRVRRCLGSISLLPLHPPLPLARYASPFRPRPPMRSTHLESRNDDPNLSFLSYSEPQIQCARRQTQPRDVCRRYS